MAERRFGNCRGILRAVRMIHHAPLPTTTAYCNHCGRETEQIPMHDGGYACMECLMDPNSRVEWEKGVRGKSKFEEERHDNQPAH